MAENITRIYLDHNATMPMRKEISEALSALKVPGNPSSVHAEGRRARALLEEAREKVAAWAMTVPDRVVFTSGGTESNALAIHSFGSKVRRKTASIDPGSHPSIRLNLRGWEISSDAEAVFCMAAHNETGVITDLKPVIADARRRNALIHVDAVQMPGKLPFDKALRDADLVTISGHKIGGPMGAGALICGDEIEIEPLIRGGGQEFGRRSGTPPLQAIVGLGIALALPYDSDRCRALAVRFSQAAKTAIGEVDEISDCARGLPGTVLLAFKGIRGDVMVPALDSLGIAASYGSACSSGEQEASPALLGLGISKAIAETCVRFSIGPDNTVTEIDEAVGRIARAIRRIREVFR